MSRQYPIYLTGNKDTDRIVLDNITDDRQLLEICKTNKTVYQRVCDENFFRNRVMSKYPETVQYKDAIKTRTWKNHFLNIVNYIDLLKTEYHIEYKGEGSPELEYLARKSSLNFLNYSIDLALIYIVRNGELPLLKYLLERGGDIDHINRLFIDASLEGHLPIVKYLVQHGADIKSKNNAALRSASKYGYFDIVKYLVEHGADIHVNNDEALKFAIENGHSDVVEYLKSIKI